MTGQSFRRWCALAAAGSLAGCAGNQSALDPAGVQASRISDVWWFYFWVTAAVYLAVIVAMFVALVRGLRRVEPSSAANVPLTEQHERRRGKVVLGLAIATAVTLFVLMIVDFRSGRAIASLGGGTDAIRKIRVTGHQWWWEVEYVEAQPHLTVTTANELHLPAGVPLEFELLTTDVIHSFWIPNLHGKRDLIPGQTTSLRLQADREGTYYGQCAEFCGMQHANMRLVVTVESRKEFDDWLARQRATAPKPKTDSERRGRDVFMSTTCVMCHSIGGTDARGLVGPSLTHIASRPFIGAGMLPNSRGHLAGWITDPQSIKPGIRMPPNVLPPDDLKALLDYLETLH
jgi:cytochrome c oxidase subunit 2